MVDNFAPLFNGTALSRALEWIRLPFRDPTCGLLQITVEPSADDSRANSVDDILMINFLFFPENRIWYFMQIASIGPLQTICMKCQNLFQGKLRKIFQ